MLGHMPFVFDFGDGPVLFYCEGERKVSSYGNEYEYVNWHVCAKPLYGDGRTVITPPGDSITCNPVVYADHKRVYMTCVTADIMPEQPANYRLVRYSGRLFDKMVLDGGMAVDNPNIFTGMSNGTLTVTALRNKMVIYDLETFQNNTVIFPEGTQILRVSYADDKRNLIVTYMLNGPHSVMYDATAHVVTNEITADGTPVYKCALWDGQVIHAVKGESFEDRTLVHGKLRLVPASLPVSVADYVYEPETLVEAPTEMPPNNSKQSFKTPQKLSLVQTIMSVEDDSPAGVWVKNMASQVQDSMRRQFPNCGQRRKHLAHCQEKLKYYWTEYQHMRSINEKSGGE